MALEETASGVGLEIPLAYSPLSGHERPEHATFSADGLDTDARVTDNGRFDINLHESEADIAGLLDTLSKPPTVQEHRIHPISEDLQFPVKLNIVIHVVGSRGDVQPFIVLGQALKTHGHRVRLATHLVFRDFVKENGLEFFNIGGNPAELMSFMVKNPKLIPKMESLIHGDIGRRRREIRLIIAGCWRSCFEAGEGIDCLCNAPGEERSFVADAIIANPPSFAHIHCAERMAIPLHLMFTMPWSPTQAFPHPLANVRTCNAKPSVAKITSYAVVEMLIWQGLGDLQNQFRRFELGLEPLDSLRAPSLIHRLRIPFTYMWSPSLLPKPDDWLSHIDVTGFNFLKSAENYEPPADLQTFLESGPPPIYIGFGSIVVDDPDALTQTVLEAVRLTDQRALISQGWGGLHAENFDSPEVFFLGNCPHDWLFQRVSCVVHHGGAGTTAMGLALGRPTAIVPFFGDQPFWGALVALNEAGPWPIPFSKLTADRLADAIHHCLEPKTVTNAQRLSERIRGEDGAEGGVASFHRQLDLKSLQCSICPDRPAVWRVRRTKTLLSPLAASVLVREKYLDPHDLKLHRGKRYDTHTDPRGPFYAGAKGVAGGIGNFISGLVDVPMNIVQSFSRPAHSRFARDYDLPACSERSPVVTTSRNTSFDMVTPEPERDKTLESTSSKETADTSYTTDSGDGACMAVQKTSTISYMVANTSYTCRRILNLIIEIPMGITLLLSQGFHDAPRWYHDRTVRDTPVVSDVRSGFAAAGKEFRHSWSDGITGVVAQPRTGWKDQGMSGMAKGIGKGIGGVFLKPQAGLWGLLGYPLNGMFRGIEKSYGANREDYVVASRIRQGNEDLAAASESECASIVDQWKVIEKPLRPKRQRKLAK
ncbi:hypothetical protein P175DRAFT_0543946 [Aspergillus ochraceoroseus IBT 24754]|uniref:Glycosyltransferase family 28 N-terminal domain-containing protein n=1 Tax=Aspergillus ochraceoroseus IBT 24754 TaxID=1392256 RepID=A0A2T5M4T5_9EURO|nr:uncharacterized protein P175DRAFT_0543946 [Aspergillus ochraceoroseus IBT 24754]PTU23545.1 hypothetical protein P175DRAFT_0543946 [Aspergillus ochraceoroseus IBT 24754]